MRTASFASMALLAACGGLTDQGTTNGNPNPIVTETPPPSPAAPAPGVQHVADDVGVPSAIAVAQDRVLFTTAKTKLNGQLVEDGALWVTTKTLAPALVLAIDLMKHAHYETLAVDDGFAYVGTSDARLFRVPIAGGASEAIADLPAAAVALVASGDHVYFATSSGVVERAPKDGTGTIEPVATVAGRPRAVSVDDAGAVYVATSVTEGEGGSIVKVAAPGAEPTVLTTSAASPCAMIRDGKKLFFTASGGVQRLPLEGGPASIVAAGAFAACAIASDTEELWFASGEDGRLLRAPEAGGAPEHVSAATNALATPGSVAVDATHVYWLEESAVLRLAKSR